MFLTEYVLSFDPGVSTGVALLGYNEVEPAYLIKAWQFSNGVSGLLSWLGEHWRESYWDSEWGTQYPPTLWLPELGPDKQYFWAGSTFEDSFNPENGDYEMAEAERGNLTVICEKFTARNTNGFSYTTVSLEPLRCEGALIAKSVMDDYANGNARWRDPSMQYLVGGKDLADKKKRQHAFLGESGFYVTGRKDLGAPNADDARSAIAHGLTYIYRVLEHKPTYNLVSQWTKE